jgi:hypothetical protein
MADNYHRIITANNGFKPMFFKRPGQKLTITFSSGEWRTNRDENWLGPEGHPSTNGSNNFPAPGKPEMCLLARLNERIHVVGREFELYGPEEGVIEMGPNDDKTRDNLGSITVKFEYTSS